MVANAIACLGSGKHKAAIDVFDVVFEEDLPNEKQLLLLIKVCACYAKATSVGRRFSEGGTHEETLRPQDLKRE